MSNNIGKQGKVRNALERLDAAEADLNLIKGDLQNIANFVNGEKEDTTQRFAAFAEVIEAIIQTLGQDVIETKIQESRTKRDEQAVKALQGRVEDAVKNGVLKSNIAVEDDSFLLFSETSADGKAVRPGLISAPFSFFSEEVRERLKGKTEGETVEGLKGSSIEIKGIYSVVKPEPQETEEVAAPADAAEGE